MELLTMKPQEITTEKKIELLRTLKYYQDELDELRCAIVNVCDEFDTEDYDLHKESEQLNDAINAVRWNHIDNIILRIQRDF